MSGTSPSLPPAELLEWIASVTAQPITALRPMDRWRPTWFVDVGIGPLRRRLLLKTPRAPAAVVARSAMLRTFGLDREADALEALQSTDVPVPELVGRRPQQAVLLGVVPGTGQVTSLPPTQRHTAMREYGRVLARLHRVDVESPAVRRLAGRSSGPRWLPGPLHPIVEDFRSVQASLDHEPLIELGLRWLRDHVPAPVDERFLHGDAGPDQFMVHDGRVAAVLDWELAHLGDPASDLGYSRFREALYPTGAYGEVLAGYADAGGAVGPAGPIGWYTAVAALVMLIGMNRSVQRPRITNPEMAQRLWWDALARMALCQVLSEQLGQPAAIPSPAAGIGRGHPAAVRVRDLLEQYPTEVDGGAARTRAQLVAASERFEEISTAGRAPGAPDDLAELVHDLTGEAASGVWALAPLAVLDNWSDGAPAEWEERIRGPVVPAIPSPPEMAVRRP